MDSITTASYRTICYKHGADLTFSEIVRFESLAKKNKSSLSRIELFDDTPTMIQIIGKDEVLLEQFLAEFQPSKGFQGFNFNLCCPSHNYVKQGLGAAMVKRPTKTKRMAEIVKSYGHNVNVKLRLGLTKEEKEEKIYLKLLETVDADFFIVHARYRSESYNVHSDWSVFSECVETGKRIIANGDIQTLEDIEYMKELGCEGVMIGRAAISNPLIFGKLKNKEMPAIDVVRKEYDELREKFQEKKKVEF